MREETVLQKNKLKILDYLGWITGKINKLKALDSH